MGSTNAESMAARLPEGEGWDADTIGRLKIKLADVADNTSDFTRSQRWGARTRHYDIKMKFGVDDIPNHQYLATNGVIIPYVPPPKKKDGSIVNSTKYGGEFFYGCFSTDLLNAIVAKAKEEGYTVREGDPALVSSSDDWWHTVNIANKASICSAVGSKKSLRDIIAATKSGVIANLGLSIKLKCTIAEEYKEDGILYGPSDASPARPDSNTLWDIAVSAVWGFVTDVDIPVDPPVKISTGKYTSSVPITAKPEDSDKPQDDMIEKMKKLGLY